MFKLMFVFVFLFCFVLVIMEIKRFIKNSNPLLDEEEKTKTEEMRSDVLEMRGEREVRKSLNNKFEEKIDEINSKGELKNE